MCILLTFYILFIGICSRLVKCQYGFAYPNATDPVDKNLALDLGQIIDIQWRTPFPTINLGFIAEDGKVFEFFSRKSQKISITHHVTRELCDQDRG